MTASLVFCSVLVFAVDRVAGLRGAIPADRIRPLAAERSCFTPASTSPSSSRSSRSSRRRRASRSSFRPTRKRPSPPASRRGWKRSATTRGRTCGGGTKSSTRSASPKRACWRRTSRRRRRTSRQVQGRRRHRWAGNGLRARVIATHVELRAKAPAQRDVARRSDQARIPRQGRHRPPDRRDDGQPRRGAVRPVGTRAVHAISSRRSGKRSQAPRRQRPRRRGGRARRRLRRPDRQRRRRRRQAQRRPASKSSCPTRTRPARSPSRPPSPWSPARKTAEGEEADRLPALARGRAEADRSEVRRLVRPRGRDVVDPHDGRRLPRSRPRRLPRGGEDGDDDPGGPRITAGARRQPGLAWSVPGVARRAACCVLPLRGWRVQIARSRARSRNLLPDAVLPRPARPHARIQRRRRASSRRARAPRGARARPWPGAVRLAVMDAAARRRC